MNRLEEIWQAFQKYKSVTETGSLSEGDFISGAEWADEWWNKRILEIDLSSTGRLHNIWKGMRQRCNNPKATGFAYYGGKGIKVCDEWNKFFNFAAWSLLNGYNEELTIDRIDITKDYCPNNCRWASYKIQGNNTSRNHFVKGMTIAQHAENVNMNYRTMHNRIVRSGMDVENALTSPPYNPKTVYQYDMSGNFIARYNSAREACEAISGKSKTRNHIDDVCRGQRNSAFGYKWSYFKL